MSAIRKLCFGQLSKFQKSKCIQPVEYERKGNISICIRLVFSTLILTLARALLRWPASTPKFFGVVGCEARPVALSLVAIQIRNIQY